MIVCLAKGHIIKLHTDDNNLVMEHLHLTPVMQLALVAAAQKAMPSESISTLVAIAHMPDDTTWSELLDLAPRIRKHEYEGPHPVVYITGLDDKVESH